MAKVTISNVDVRDNPCHFKHTFQFEITFECAEDLSEDLEWKLIYVGSAESEQYDQVLDTIAVGPVIAGKHMFVFETNAPNIARIPKSEVVGVTVVLLTCYYRQQEFIRVGYYVNNEYSDPELKESPPNEPDFDKLQRNILATCPRVTRFKIDWGCGDGSDSPGPGVDCNAGGVIRDIDDDLEGGAEHSRCDDEMDGDSPGTSNLENIPPPPLANMTEAGRSCLSLEGTQDSLMSLPSLDTVGKLSCGDPLADKSNSLSQGLDGFPAGQSEPMQL